MSLEERTKHKGETTTNAIEQMEEMSEYIRYYFCADRCDSDFVAEVLFTMGYCKREWISVADRLPDEDGKYIVCTAKNTVYCTRYYARGKHFGAESATHITHWMPLPEPPKGE